MVNNFDPLLAIMRGQAIHQGTSQAEREGMELADREALRKAAAGMGSQNYFAGFEGMPGAERPDYLKRLYAEGDPETAMKMESFLTPSLATDRDIKKAGEIERVKKEADAKVWSQLMKDFTDSETGRSINAFGDRMQGGGEEAPSSPAVGEPASMRPAPNLGSLSGTESNFKVGPQGPEFSIKRMSPFEKAVKEGEDTTRRATTKVAQDAEARQTVQQVHDNIRKTVDQIRAIQTGMQNRDIPWDEGKAELEQLNGDLAAFTAQRDALQRGKTTPAPAPSVPRTSIPIPSSGTPKFTGKEQGALDVKNREEQMTAANKEIANARLGTEKVMKFKRQVGELYDLVTKQDIGHPTFEGVPGAANILSMSRSNAQVKKLAESIINMFAEPGQSQMMNTIVERQMQGAVVPNIFTDPQLNKINAAVLRSNVEHLSNFPTFLEKWQKSHNNTLEGAADAWIDYTSNNPLYTYTKDARGRVTTQENSHVIPITKWMKLRETGGIRKVGDRMFIRHDDGSWIEK